MTITSTVRCVTTNGEKNRQKKSRPNAQSADRWAITSKMKEAWMGMSDTKVLWELCRHGRGPSHYYSIDEAGASQGNLRCPGGKKYVMRQVWVRRSQFNVDWEAQRSAERDRPVWVEVTE